MWISDLDQEPGSDVDQDIGSDVNQDPGSDVDQSPPLQLLRPVESLRVLFLAHCLLTSSGWFWAPVLENNIFPCIDH